MAGAGGSRRLTGSGRPGPKWLPGVAAVRTYQRANLRGDLVAGLAVTALLVPQGMAYAQLSGLPAVTGLYTTMMALLAYAVFGPSRMLVLGPDSALAPLILATILPLIGAGGDPARAVALGSALAIVMGLICLIAGFGRLGIVTELLSRPLRVGYLNGIAVVVVVSQLPKLCGFSVDAEDTLSRLRQFAAGVADDKVNSAALVIGVACLVVLFTFRARAPRIPAVLIAVVGSTLAVWALGLVENGVGVVGPVPQGFPAFALPSFPLDDLWRLILGAFGMAFITLADTTALSRTFALKYKDRVDPNQEIVALGTANLATGLFQGFPVSVSTSRTAVSEAAGGRSQAVGVVGALSITLLLVFANGLTTYLPEAALAAIVIVAGTALFDLVTMRWLWKVRPTEFLLCLAALLGVALVGVLEGIGIAIALSLAAFLQRIWRPYDTTLGRVSGRHGYHDMSRHADGVQVPGLVIFRFDAPVFFANAEHFSRRVKRHIAARVEPIHRVLIAAEPITDVDSTGAESLFDLVEELRLAGVSVGIAELKGPVKDRLRRYGLYDRIGDENFYSSLDHAVTDFLLKKGHDPLRWVDDFEADGLEELD